MSFHWLWVIIIVIPWYIARLSTSNRIDDKLVKGWVIIISILAFAINGLLGAWIEVNVLWWLFLLIWVLLGSEIVIAATKDRLPFLQFILILLGWFILAIIP